MLYPVLTVHLSATINQSKSDLTCSSYNMYKADFSCKFNATMSEIFSESYTPPAIQATQMTSSL
jgi:hypothetical protein